MENPGATSIELAISIDGVLQEGDKVFLPAGKKATVAIKSIKDKYGNEASIDGKPAFALSNEALGGLEVAEDGKSAVFTSNGLMGSLKVQVSADADLGEGVKSILAEGDIEVLAGEAEVIELDIQEVVE